MDEPLEEVGDAGGSCRALNFVESDGLSRVRVCHVSFTPASSKRGPTGRRGQIERGEEDSVRVFGREKVQVIGLYTLRCDLFSEFKSARVPPSSRYLPSM